MTECRAILVLVDNGPAREYPFSTYITEILDSEGIRYYDVHDLSAGGLEAGDLAGRELVILSHMEPAEPDLALLEQYVQGGGSLLALRPPRALARLFGLQWDGCLCNEGYVTLNPEHPLAQAVPASSLQFHGSADVYRAGGSCTTLAHLAAALGERTPYPALVTCDYGQGRAAAFTFDLAASTVLFHQGRRENCSLGANADADGDLFFKPNDLFYGYADERLKDVPQADIYGDMLVWLIGSLLKRPLPRLWHFPGAAPAVAYLDGDSDSMKTAWLEELIECVESGGGVYTLFLMPSDFAALEPQRMRELQARGHDFGLHYWVSPQPTLEQIHRGIQEQTAAFRARYGCDPVSTRGHCLVWAGWTEQAGYLLEAGIRLDTNYTAVVGFQSGYLNGSGQPVRFCDEAGRVIDVYEQATLSTDDGVLTDKSLLPRKTREEAIALSLRQIDEAIDRYHTVYHPYFHPWWVGVSEPALQSGPWIRAVAAHIAQRGIPFVNARNWLAFNDARRTAVISDLTWSAERGELSFTVTAPRAVAGLTVLLPLEYAGREAAPALVEGGACARVVELEKRRQLAVVMDLEAGAEQRVSLQYQAR